MARHRRDHLALEDGLQSRRRAALVLLPGCGQRAAKLYLYAPRFCCRDCLGLPYASQQETVLDRANRKAFKLRKRLNSDGGIGDPI